MKRLFEIKLKSPEKVHLDIKIAYHKVCRFYCAYGKALMPDALGLYPGYPGASGGEEWDEDLALLEAMRYLVDQSIKNHKIIKSGVHPLDSVTDSQEFDGCDGPYSSGLFERPKEWCSIIGDDIDGKQTQSHTRPMGLAKSRQERRPVGRSRAPANYPRRHAKGHERRNAANAERAGLNAGVRAECRHRSDQGRSGHV